MQRTARHTPGPEPLVGDTRTEAARPMPAKSASCPVNSWNEWDPLEEVIVGHIDGAVIPPYHIAVFHNIAPPSRRLLRLFGGIRYPRFLAKRARQELDGLVRLLEAEGVRVRRPDRLNFARLCRTPHWSSRGFTVACPRDSVLVVGDEIIETPMSWRSRYFEMSAYRSLFKEYFRQGARWTAAPRPELRDELYDENYTVPAPGEPLRFVVNEFEPVFDAADFVRCGRDLFVTRSNVTNRSGIEWLRRHLGELFRIHEIKTRCRTPMHIDSTLIPLAPGKVLVNPDFVDPEELPSVLKTWDVLVAPPPDPLPPARRRLSMVSRWISVNVLSLDAERVIVERSQTSMIAALKRWGFKPIPLDFVGYGTFGGAFHCATLDIRRRGRLQSYF
jgi:glycine amidinotransferase